MKREFPIPSYRVKFNLGNILTDKLMHKPVDKEVES